jgi:prephenate dehydrogenase
MAKATITIVGLGKRGSSIGLALRAPELDFQVIGHDKEAVVAKKARSLGAVHTTAWNLISACETADVIILTIPFDQVEPTLKAIGQDIREGCVVLDTSPYTLPGLHWAEQHLKSGAHLVGIALGRNPEHMQDQTHGPDGARADLFANSPCCIMPAATVNPAAVKTAQDIALLLKADPYFLDPAEFDGVSTAVHLMPALTAAALIAPATASPGWREMQRLSSTHLLNLSEPLEDGGAALAQAAMLNKASTLNWLDITLTGLQMIRSWVAEENSAALTEQLEMALKMRDEWLAAWRLNRWERNSTAAEIPAAGGLFGQLLGFRPPRKPAQSGDSQ